MRAGQCVTSVGREFKFRALQTSASVFALGLTVARERVAWQLMSFSMSARPTGML